MIKNEREYKVTKSAASRFRDAIAAHDAADHAEKDPISVKAEAAAMRAQLADLDTELRDYERLVSGGIESLDASRVDDLPKLLIKARIAQGLTHKDLADRIGVREQQIQRWEEEDYESAAFWRLVEVADALDVSFVINAHLPQPSSPNVDIAVSKLKSFGIDKEFVRSKLVPRAEGASDRSVDAKAECARIFAARIEAISGQPLPEFIAMNDDDPWWLRAVANSRYKLGAVAKERPVAFYTAYARFLAAALCDAINAPVDQVLPTDWRDMRALLFGSNNLDYATAVRRTWELGIPILPLCDRISFHGACWRIHGRGAIALKQPMQTPSWWLFDLLHELYHLAEAGPCDEFAAIEAEGTSDGRRLSPEEARAHSFAADVLLEGKADRLYQAALREAKGRMGWLKRSVRKIATEEGVDVAYLANHVAFKVAVDQGESWWGAARNLQTDMSSPYETARDILLENLDLGVVAEPAGGLLRQALTPKH